MAVALQDGTALNKLVNSIHGRSNGGSLLLHSSQCIRSRGSSQMTVVLQQESKRQGVLLLLLLWQRMECTSHALGGQRQRERHRPVITAAMYSTIHCTAMYNTAAIITINGGR